MSDWLSAMTMALARLGVDAQVDKVTRTSEMIPYGVMSTPAVVIDERVMHARGIPTQEEIERWIRGLQ
jgi:hypothetical protein